MRTNRSLLVLAALSLAPLACKSGGCGGGNSATAEDSGAPSASVAMTASAPSASASTVSTAARAHAMQIRAGGAPGALFRAASGLESITDDERTKVEKIASDYKDAEKAALEVDGGGPQRTEMKAINDEILAGVKAGSIPAAKLEPHLAALEKDAKERQNRDVDALAKLHDVLTPEQRKEIGDDVQKTEQDRFDKAKAQEAAQAKNAPDGGGGMLSSAARRRYERYSKDLNLDADQMKKFDNIIPKDDPKQLSDMRDDAKKRADAIITAFEKDTFDAKTVPAPETKQVRRPIEEQVKFYNGLLPILKPEQKDKLAQRVEKSGGAPGGPMGGMMPGGPGGRPGMPQGIPGHGGMGMGRGGGNGGDREHNEPNDDNHAN